MKLRYTPIFDGYYAGNRPVESSDQGIGLFEAVGMPAKNLPERSRHKYANDLHFRACHVSDVTWGDIFDFEDRYF